MTRERYNEMLENCLRGPNRDALSIECVAALPEVAPEPGEPAAAGAPAVTVAEVREYAIDQITMGAPEVGASPCQSAADACRGTVGVPVWLWVGDGNGSLPSDSATASAG
ncbi:hypothetical protein, partial [Janibacter anophelis]|uniref:hypothetical protein n=2 Tax=Janibacter anophelis TaxID=319054 RepID=UPI0039F0787E